LSKRSPTIGAKPSPAQPNLSDPDREPCGTGVPIKKLSPDVLRMEAAEDCGPDDEASPSGQEGAASENAKVHRRISKRRESREQPPELPTQVLLRWPSNSRSVADAAISCTSSNSSPRRRLCGGARRIRTPGAASTVYERSSGPIWRIIRSNKSICSEENVFARDSALLRISQVPFVRQADARKLATRT
jgi:hypothetical protein